MDGFCWLIYILLLYPIIAEGWHIREDRRYDRGLKGDIHYHSKRHMLPREVQQVQTRKRYSTMRPKDGRKKPSGYLKPLHEDDMENDEVVSVAVGPPAIRPKYEKVMKHDTRPINHNVGRVPPAIGANIVKDVLTQLGREFLSHHVTEEFVFGQYVGNSMKNLTNDLKLKMQHEILDLIVRYQKVNNGDNGQTTTVQPDETVTNNNIPQEIKDIKERKNDTDEGWPDFNNLAKIVG